MSCGSEFNKWD